jgi:hypothetical protein
MQVQGDDAAVVNCSASGCASPSVEDDDDLDFENWDDNEDAGARESNSDSSGDEVDDTLSLVQ